MLAEFRTSVSGMQVQQIAVDIISNNIANATTPGYKRSDADFKALLYAQYAPAGD